MMIHIRRAVSASLALLVAAGVLFGQRQQPRQVPVDSLIFDLKNPDPVRRKDAAVALGLNRVQRAVPDLVATAKDSDVPVRREVLFALDRMGDPRSVPAFVLLMADSDKEIRERAIHCVLNLYVPPGSGISANVTRVANLLNPWSDEWADTVAEPGIPIDPTVSPALRDRLRDSEEGIRAKAARGLGILRARDALTGLIDALKGDESTAVRFECIRALRKIADPAVAPEVLPYASHLEGRVRHEAVLTLGRLRYRGAVAELTRLFEKESALPPKRIDKVYWERLLGALAFIADPSSRDLFVKETKNPEDLIRLRAFEGLARTADVAHVTEISRSRLHEKDARVQAAQAFALYRMGRKEYLDEVAAALGNRKSRNEALQYLVELRKEELPDLYSQIRHKDAGVRMGLAEAIGIAGDDRAIPVLQELSRDSRGQVVEAANLALRRLNARLH